MTNLPLYLITPQDLADDALFQIIVHRVYPHFIEETSFICDNASILFTVSIEDVSALVNLVGEGYNEKRSRHFQFFFTSKDILTVVHIVFLCSHPICSPPPVASH